MKRRKRLGLTVLVVGISIVATSLITALAQSADEPKTKGVKEAKQELPKCPVRGEPVNLAVSTATDDGPVFFCCSQCIPKFEAEPKKYAEKVASQRKALAALPRVQLSCPLSGEPVKSDQLVDEKGQRIFFCCKNCRGKYEKDPAKYAGKLANSYTYQTKCPVTGKAIDPQVSANAPAGETVYFCCKNCPEKFGKDPGKYAPKLEEQGLRLDLAKTKP